MLCTSNYANFVRRSEGLLEYDADEAKENCGNINNIRLHIIVLHINERAENVGQFNLLTYCGKPHYFMEAFPGC